MVHPAESWNVLYPLGQAQFRKGDTVSAKFLVEATLEVGISVFAHSGSVPIVGPSSRSTVLDLVL